MGGPDHASAEPLVEPLPEPGQLEHVVLLLRPLQDVPGLGRHPEDVSTLVGLLLDLGLLDERLVLDAVPAGVHRLLDVATLRYSGW